MLRAGAGWRPVCEVGGGLRTRSGEGEGEEDRELELEPDELGRELELKGACRWPLEPGRRMWLRAMCFVLTVPLLRAELEVMWLHPVPSSEAGKRSAAGAGAGAGAGCCSSFVTKPEPQLLGSSVGEGCTAPEGRGRCCSPAPPPCPMLGAADASRGCPGSGSVLTTNAPPSQHIFLPAHGPTDKGGWACALCCVRLVGGCGWHGCPVQHTQQAGVSAHVQPVRGTLHATPDYLRLIDHARCGTSSRHLPCFWSAAAGGGS